MIKKHLQKQLKPIKLNLNSKLKNFLYKNKKKVYFYNVKKALKKRQNSNRVFYRMKGILKSYFIRVIKSNKNEYKECLYKSFFFAAKRSLFYKKLKLKSLRKRKTNLLKFVLKKKDVIKLMDDIYRVSSKELLQYFVFFTKISLKLSLKLYKLFLKRKFYYLRASDYLFIKNLYKLYYNKEELFNGLKNLTYYLSENKLILKKSKTKYKYQKKSNRRYVLYLKKTLNNIFAYIFDTKKNKLRFVSSLGQSGLKGPAKVSQVSCEFLGKELASKCRRHRIYKLMLILTTPIDFYLKAFFKAFSNLSPEEKLKNKEANKYFRDYIYKKGGDLRHSMFALPRKTLIKKIKIVSVYFLPKYAHNGNRFKSAKRV